MRVLHERYMPGADTREPSCCVPVEESGGVVVAGRLELILEDEVSVLSVGDAYYFDGQRPHRVRDPLDHVCAVVSAAARARI